MTLRLPLVLLLLCPTVVPAADPDDHTPPEFAALKYRSVGPYAGGRVSRACGVPGDPLTYYAATASGGVWKSIDGGLTWKPIFDDQPTSSIGSIAVAPSDPNVVYVGTGEANIRGNVSPGAGLFKSTDAGKTWKHVWKQVGQIGTVAVHPTNPDVCFAAVLGHAFGPNQERGVYRTKDGGKTWDRVLFKNDETGCSDVCIDPNNPRVIVAGFWQTRRRPWELTSGGPGSDLFVSRDGGDTWESLKTPASRDRKGAASDPKKNGLPAGIWGRVGVAIAPSDSSRVYAVIEAEKGGVFRSDDGGESWSLTSDDRNLRQRAWYYSTLTVDPKNPDVVWAPQVPMLKSSDGGKSFKPARGFHHGDHHDLWIDPTNPKRMIDANDGGVDISTDGGKTWFAPPLPISQFYHVHADNHVPYRVMGCMQDLGSACGPSNSLTGGIALGDWHGVGGGEAGYAVSDPKDPNIVYAGEYGGIITRYDRRTNQSRNISVAQYNPSGIEPEKHKYRFQWTAPILVSQHTGAVYHAANFLFRTSDGGKTWEKVSADLTRNDKQKQQWSGGPITGDNSGAETYCTIFALGESPVQKGVLWAGTDDGRVWLTRDDCKTWTEVTANVPELPDWGTVECIEASPHDAGTAYLVVDNHRMDDYRPHVWKTTDFGKTWEQIVDGLDAGTHCNAVREDPRKKGLLYLGTERGIQFSTDAGKTWKSLQLNLPTVPVHDLQVKGDDLVVGTHGRSLWILDDLTAVREWKPSLGEKAFHLYPVRPAVKWYVGGGGFNRYPGSATKNPDNGAVVWFHLKEKLKDDATLEVLTADGKLVAKARAKKDDDGKDDDDDDGDNQDKKERKLPAKPGLNKFVWDFTHDGADTIPGAKVDSGNPGQTIPVAPGKYTVKLSVGKVLQTATVEVYPDARLGPAFPSQSELRSQFEKGFGMKGPDADRMLSMLTSQVERVRQISAGHGSEQQEALALKVRDHIQQLTETVLRLRAIQKQIGVRKELFKDNDAAKQQLKDEAALAKKLSTLEEKLHNPKAKIVYDVFGAKPGAMLYSQLTWLLGNVIDGDGGVTKAQQELETELSKTLTEYVGEFDKLTGDELKKLNESATKAGLPGLYLPLVKKVKEEPKAEPKKTTADVFAPNNLLAWCIVPFDGKKRGPAERVEMLKRLGFTKYVYDWRAEHLPTFDEEVQLLKKAGITLQGVWFPAGVGKDGETLLALLKKHDIKTELWVMLPQPDAKLTQDEKVKVTTELVKKLAVLAAKQGCKVGIYNHGGWTGEPANMAAVAKACGEPNVGIVYNLHHGHDHLKDLPAALKVMLPHLYCINTNGMQTDGDKKGNKILVVSEGDQDKAWLKAIRDSGYAGPVGIIGHTDDDAEARLADNLTGLKLLASGSPFKVGVRTRSMSPDGLKIQLESVTGRFFVSGFTGDERKNLADPKAWTAEKLAKALRVHVETAERDLKVTSAAPSMAGTSLFTPDEFLFIPRFPPTPGTTYRVFFDREAAFGVKGAGVYTNTFSVPKPVQTKPTTILSVFPSAEKLPENTLRFYVQFSAPMAKGSDIYKHIRLLKEDGKPVFAPFLEIDEQLWNPDGTRLTLLFDPGRVKRGLKPREEDGPILEEGKTFTFVVDRELEDDAGFPLAAGFKKVITVGPPDDKPVDPEKWKIDTATPRLVKVTFEKPLDRALAERMVWVMNAAGERVGGLTTTVSADQTGVALGDPKAVWAKGKYKLVVDTRLEDVCGNRVGRAFEVDVLRPPTAKIETKTVELPFEVK